MLRIRRSKAQDPGVDVSPTAVPNRRGGVHVPADCDRIVYRQHIMRRVGFHESVWAEYRAWRKM
jgi:hypothetical protein